MPFNERCLTIMDNKSYQNLTLLLENDSIFQQKSEINSPSSKRFNINEINAGTHFNLLPLPKETLNEGKNFELSNLNDNKPKAPLSNQRNKQVPQSIFANNKSSSQLKLFSGHLFTRSLMAGSPLEKIDQSEQKLKYDQSLSERHTMEIETDTKKLNKLGPLNQEEEDKKMNAINVNIINRVDVRTDLTHKQVSLSLKMFNVFSSDLGKKNNTCPSEKHNYVEVGVKKLKQKLAKRKQKKYRRKRRKKVSCNCKNSYCIKLYCECFRKNGVCGSHCTCENCKNTLDNKERQQRLNKIEENKKQQQGEFVLKLNSTFNKDIEIIYKGCNCVRSNCSNGYCDCFDSGVKCKQSCFCRNCVNC